ncbi:MAG: hypothetical protein JST50_03980 [Bacteroidetes bacterium]|nr:hypothetical protein [Bacteroidota bacterium]
MKKEYQNIQSSIIIDDSNLTNVTFNQAWEQKGKDIDLEKLSLELVKLKKEMLSHANAAEEYTAIANVASAEEASEKGEGSKTMQFLAKAGTWAFDTATKIGVPLAAAVIKESLGIK